MSAVAAEVVQPLKIDLGAGARPEAGFVGVDLIDYKNGNLIADLRERWPWEDNSVDDARSTHFVEHLTGAERIHFVNELHRVLKKGAACLMITPHWNSSRAYGDLTHQWPPVSEFWFYYLSKEWRMREAPHSDIRYDTKLGYSCDFDVTWGYMVNPALQVRNAEYQQFALQNFKESALDTHATLRKR